MPESGGVLSSGAVCIGGIDKARLLEALSANGIQLNPLALELFDDPRFTVGSASIQIQIVGATVAGLGLADGGTYDEIVRAASQRGLAECPIELGPHLRLVYMDQPEGSAGQPATQNKAPPGSVTIASPPLDAEESTPKGFYLRRINGTLWLRGYRSWPGHVWSPGDVFVFQRAPSRETPSP